MATFQVESTPSSGFVRTVVALPGGGFAALHSVVVGGPDQVSVFGVASDGGAVRIGTDIDLAHDGQVLTELAGGGFAVLSTVRDSSPDNGRTHAALFSASGQAIESFLLPEDISIFNDLAVRNLSAVPGEPDPWLTGFDQTGLFIERVNPQTLRPLATPEVLRVDAPSLIFDGGFGISAGFGTRGAPVTAVALTTADGRVPTYANPASIFSDREITAAGNMIVEVGISRVRASTADGGTISGGITVNLSEPDSGTIRTVATEDLGLGFVEARVAEVPGLGFAVLIVVEGGDLGTSGIIDRAEIRFYDFSGTERARAELSDLVGQRTTASDGTFSFTALFDPLHVGLRYLTVWSPRDAGGTRLPSLGTVTELAPAPVSPEIGFETIGTAYGDFLAGLGSDDSLQGRAGNDVIDGHAGDDILFGDLGDDVLRGGIGNDFLFGNEGNDIVLGGRGDDGIAGLDDDDDLSGGAGQDEIEGNDGNDVISGGSGNDTLKGQAGDDIVEGDAGDDGIEGGDGDDVIEGGIGNDTIFGDLGDDLLKGGIGNDFIFGMEGNDIAFGGAGDDGIAGLDGDDDLFGGDGVDEIEGNDGNDLLSGGDGDDTLKGQVGNDDLNGGAGDDGIEGGDGDDIIEGGIGNDIIFGGLGADQLRGGIGNDFIFGDGDNDTISGGKGDDGIAGMDGDDDIFGGGGKDVIEGGNGNDTIAGGRGRDTLTGDAGADVFLFTAIENAGIGVRRDVITDFNASEDVIDVSLMFGGNVSFVGSDPFSGNALEIRYAPGGIIQGDVNGDGVVDFEVLLRGAPALAVESFVL